MIPDDGTTSAGGLTAEFLDRWDRTPGTYPRFLPEYSADEQARNASRIESQLDQYQATPRPDKGASFSTARRLLRTVADAESAGLLEKFARQAELFAKDAQAFDPSLSRENIHQALRNVWIFNSLQTIAGIPVSCTLSCFAYSLLYPYTDNVIDSTSATSEEKAGFLGWVGDRLKGVPVGISQDSESRINSLFTMIEDEFPRRSFPAVYRGLLSIFMAQQESLRLQRESDGRKIMAITAAKGGTSVVADGLLLTGACSPVWTRFCFGFGFLLQLVDDFQDAGEDSHAGHHTLFADAEGDEAMQGLVLRLLNFSDEMLGRSLWPGEWSQALHDLFLKGCTALLFERIAQCEDQLDPGFARRIERHSPVRLSDIRRFKQNASSVRMEQPSPAGV